MQISVLYDNKSQDTQQRKWHVISDDEQTKSLQVFVHIDYTGWSACIVLDRIAINSDRDSPINSLRPSDA